MRHAVPAWPAIEQRPTTDLVPQPGTAVGHLHEQTYHVCDPAGPVRRRAPWQRLVERTRRFAEKLDPSESKMSKLVVMQVGKTQRRHDALRSRREASTANAK